MSVIATRGNTDSSAVTDRRYSAYESPEIRTWIYALKPP
jgi:hypothetical protein